MSGCTDCGGEAQISAILGQLQHQRKKQAWSEKVKEIMKDINDADPKDRLDYALEFTRLFYALAFTLNGWGQWLGFRVQIEGVKQVAGYNAFRKLSLEECQAIYPQFKALILELLKLDYELSLAKEKEMEAEIEKRKKTKKSNKKTGKKRKKKTTYIQ